jgi:hypothetical protein
MADGQLVDSYHQIRRLDLCGSQVGACFQTLKDHSAPIEDMVRVRYAESERAIKDNL